MSITYGGEVGKRSLIFSFGDIFGRLFGRRNTAVKRVLENILAELEINSDVIEEVTRKLHKRYNELHTQALRAVTQKNMARATIYANEMIEIKKIFKRLKIALIFIEQLRLRIGTLSELDKITPSLANFQKLLEMLKPQIAPIVPNVAVSLERVMAEINSLTGATSSPEPQMVDQIKPENKEAADLLKQIVVEAEKSVNETLPEMLPELARFVSKEVSDELVSLPDNIFAVQTEAPSIKQAKNIKKENKTKQAETSKQGSKQENRQQIPIQQKGSKQNHRQGIALKVRGSDIEKMLIDYITSRGGFLDINDFTKTYGYSKEDVIKALNKLADKKMVNIVNSPSQDNRNLVPA